MYSNRKKLVVYVGVFALFVAGLLLFVAPTNVRAANLMVTPSSGTFHVGSTFDVSVVLDTEGETINTVDLKIFFPPNKLQLVSPKTSLSAITLWASQPRFNNSTGVIELQGGIPGGINSSSALISSFTFRVRSVGTAVVAFADTSKVLLNDGQGTDVLHRRTDGVFSFRMPPPQGPTIASPTHPQEGTWYAATDVVFNWSNGEDSAIEGYSYLLSESPSDTPDDIVDGKTAQATYKQVSDGTHFFHVKALRNGIWGGTSHRAVNIDSQPPADFSIQILPSEQTAAEQPIVTFRTSDRHSGISHYELAVIPLSRDAQVALNGGNQSFFIEATSPHILQEIHPGTYDVIVRAIDQVGNVREVNQKLDSVATIISLSVGRGIIIENVAVIPWWVVWIVILGLVVALLLLVLWLKRRHRRVRTAAEEKVLPQELKQKLDELQTYRNKYGQLMVALLVIFASLFLSTPAFAQDVSEDVTVTPPVIEVIPRAITNNEIFYVGGYVDQPNTDIIIYRQSKETQETRSFITRSDEQGEWFHRDDTFLSAGEYFLWTQARQGSAYSPPSARTSFSVEKAAIQLGVSRLTYTLLYQILLLVALAVIISLVVYAAIQYRRIREKRKVLEKEVRDVEEEIRRDFAMLRRGIEAELERLHKDKIDDKLQEDQIAHEEELLKDLARIEKKLQKEVREVERELS